MPNSTLLLLSLPFLLLLLPHNALADVGTAASYGPPYLPTACYGSSQGQFPADEMFAAAGEGIWDKGAACGRQYVLRCLSATAAGACVDGQRTVVTVVDRAATLRSQPSMNGTTMVLSAPAFSTIASPSVPQINIEFIQV